MLRNDVVIERWARNHRPDCQSGSVTANGAWLCSYGTAIGYRFDSRITQENPVFFLSADSYSVTTNRHQSCAYWAARRCGSDVVSIHNMFPYGEWQPFEHKSLRSLKDHAGRCESEWLLDQFDELVNRYPAKGNILNRSRHYLKIMAAIERHQARRIDFEHNHAIPIRKLPLHRYAKRIAAWEADTAAYRLAKRMQGIDLI